MKRVIITADDFGMAVAVNEAVEIACRVGVLTTASLMVGAAAADDAVERARRLPCLRVGLHVVLVDGQPLLPSELLPALVGTDGRFLRNLTAAGFRYFFLPGARRQLEAELRAQFTAFAATGLALDHVNAHNHFHLHPTVLGLILKVGREFGLRAIRLPREPWLSGLGEWALSPWTALLRGRLRRAGIRCNDFVLGLTNTGAMTEAVVLELLERLERAGGLDNDRVAEFYFHPATSRCPELIANMPGYDHEGELQALTSERVRLAFASRGIALIAFGDLP
ncbi:MAG: hopanoid biosynthesis-associated protein HpnK [Rhodospirillaceae bacterium]